MILTPDETFDQTAGDLEAMLFSFDVLLSGVSKEQVGPPPPEIDQELFFDGFDDPGSGLIEDEQEQDWGRGYYDSSGRYVFELKPDPGAIYDFYPDITLPDEFVLQASAAYDGADDNAYGLIFQLLQAEDDDDPDRFYTFRITGDGFYTVEKAGDSLEPIIDWTFTDAINQQPGADNLLTVERLGDDSYNIYINNRQVNSFSDDLTMEPAGSDQAIYQTGTIGLMVDNYDPEIPVVFTFDDLAVGTSAE